MGTLNVLIEQIQRTLREWRAPGAGDLVFDARSAALLAVASFIILTATALTWRSLRGRLPGRTAIALPAMLPRIRQSPITFIRHLPFALFLLGLPFFCLALADPYASLSSHSGWQRAVASAPRSVPVRRPTPPLRRRRRPNPN